MYTKKTKNLLKFVPGLLNHKNNYKTILYLAKYHNIQLNKKIMFNIYSQENKTFLFFQN